MPITIDDNDFPASYDTTLNLLQIVRSQAHLIKKITGKGSWLEYPDNSIQEILTELQSYDVLIDNLTNQNNTNATNINSNTNAINAINSIARPSILWKTTRGQSHTIGTTASTLYTITIPANTCAVNSILKLHLDVWGSNTTNTRTLIITCNGVTISSIPIAQNTWYPIVKTISFNNALNAPYTTATGAGGYSTSAAALLSFSADFSQQQTILVRASASVANETLIIQSGYLELI